MKKVIAMTAAAAVLFAGVPGMVLPARAEASSDWGKVVGTVIGAILSSGKEKEKPQPTGSPQSEPVEATPRWEINNRVIEREPTTNERMLFVAIEKGDYETVKQMLDAGVDINAFYRFKSATPLSCAIYNDHREIMQLLLERGADVRGYVSSTQKYYLHSYFVQATANGDLPLMEYLHNWGAPINSIQDVYASYPRNALLSMPLGSRGLEICRYLVAQGINVNYRANDGTTPLMYVSHTYTSFDVRREFLKILLDAGADPHLKDKTGHTAIDYCLKNNDLENAQLLQRY